MTNNKTQNDGLFESEESVFNSKTKEPEVNQMKLGNSVFPSINNSNLTKNDAVYEEKFAVSDDTQFVSDDGINESETVAEEKDLEEFHYVEPKNPFASGLPIWTLEPPNLPVLRKNRP